MLPCQTLLDMTQGEHWKLEQNLTDGFHVILL